MIFSPFLSSVVLITAKKELTFAEFSKLNSLGNLFRILCTESWFE